MPPRSPILFWLLLAATLAVDAVAIVWLAGSAARLSAAATLFIALAYGQLSALCDWAAFRSTLWIRWLVPFAAGLAIALTITITQSYHSSGPMIPWEQLLAFTSLLWVHVAVLWLVLWLLKPTRLFSHDASISSRQSWRFNIKHLFILLTCLPILVIAFKNSAIVRHGITLHGFEMFVAWVAVNAALLIAIAVIIRRQWLLPLRFAACLGAAIVVGMLLQRLLPDLSKALNMLAFSLIQTFVIWAWLELFRKTRDETTDVGETATTKAIP
jgi:hypothetical protein